MDGVNDSEPQPLMPLSSSILQGSDLFSLASIPSPRHSAHHGHLRSDAPRNVTMGPDSLPMGSPSIAVARASRSLGLPCLVNASEDPLLTAVLMFPLRVGVTRIGAGGSSARSSQDIIIGGPGIRAEHCLILNAPGPLIKAASPSPAPVVSSSSPGHGEQSPHTPAPA